MTTFDYFNVFQTVSVMVKTVHILSSSSSSSSSSSYFSTTTITDSSSLASKDGGDSIVSWNRIVREMSSYHRQGDSMV